MEEEGMDYASQLVREAVMFVITELQIAHRFVRPHVNDATGLPPELKTGLSNSECSGLKDRPGQVVFVPFYHHHWLRSAAGNRSMIVECFIRRL
jgi:hypothetical protein